MPKIDLIPAILLFDGRGGDVKLFETRHSFSEAWDGVEVFVLRPLAGLWLQFAIIY